MNRSPLFIAVFLCPSLAAAQPDVDEPRAAEAVPAVQGSHFDARSRASDQIVMPAGTFTLGSSISFLVAPESPFKADDEIRFTDVVLLGLGARYGIKDRGELSASLTILPKQPSFTDELVWQSASIGGRYGFKRRYAGWTQVSAGPTYGADGMWASGAFGLEGQKPLHETVILNGTLGANTVGLFPDGDAGKMTDAAWFTEVTAGGEIVVRDPRGMFGMWLGTAFHFPVAVLSESQMFDIDPQTRVNFDIGGVVSAIDDWDISLQVSVVDRGDIEDPRTTLPMLAGGFDQTHIMFGLTRRFKRARGSTSMIQIAH